MSVYINRLHVLHIISCSRSLLPDVLRQSSSHPLPSLHYLNLLCWEDSDVRALTAFLHQCTDLRTLNYVRGPRISESVEKKMWKATVRRCRELEEVRVGGVDIDESCRRLMKVLGKLSEMEGIQAQKLRKIVEVDLWGEVRKDYTDQVKHLLPALQLSSYSKIAHIILIITVALWYGMLWYGIILFDL